MENGSENKTRKNNLSDCEWLMSPREFLDQNGTKLSGAADQLYRILVDICRIMGYSQYSNEYYQVRCDRGRDKIEAAIKELILNKKIILLKGGNGHNNIYIINKVDFINRLKILNHPVYDRMIKIKKMSNKISSEQKQTKNKHAKVTAKPPEQSDHALIAGLDRGDQALIAGLDTYDQALDQALIAGLDTNHSLLYFNTNNTHTHNPKYLREIKSPNTEPLPFVCEGGVEGNLAQNLNENDKCTKNTKQKKFQVIDLQGKSAANTSDNLYYHLTNGELSAGKSVNKEINKYFIIIKNIYPEKMLGNVEKANSIFIREAQKQKDLKKYVDEIVAGITEQKRLLEIRERTHNFTETATYLPYLAKYLSEKTWLRYQPVKKLVKKKYPEPEFKTYRDDQGRLFANLNEHEDTCECEICTKSKNPI